LEVNMKLIGAALGIAAMCAIGVAAQTRTLQEESKQKIEVKDGKKVTIHGCLERTADGAYIVTNDRGGLKYELITSKNLSEDVGRFVQVRGKATDRGDAKVKIESKVGTTGSKATTTTDEELKGNLGLRYLGVDSVKKLSKSCS
jgi:hypothetical protein